ncbi:MAG TPA: hypothetical protein VIU12_27245 [Chryseolinea sp.]
MTLPIQKTDLHHPTTQTNPKNRTRTVALTIPALSNHPLELPPVTAIYRTARFFFTLKSCCLFLLYRVMDDIDKLLSRIEKESGYNLLGNCFCLQGDPDFKFFRVKPIEEVFQKAFIDFSTSMSCPFVTIGISEDNELWRMKTEMIGNGQREFKGNVVVGDSLSVIEGEPSRSFS